ncbi:CRIB domain-containing protein RIC4 isoform X2 [Cucumis sativus]|uniref:CRIB domain-containing protein RIC4 isoform X2 n=1 Tax=Cucumis sativus TaxID=3659 RepID=UPI0012F4820F|nr:CRIB domain-containing protein RIC4 isoform X2 [Cucumis sativus]
MRRKMERLVLLPFSVGCISETSVAVGIQHNSTTSKPHPISSPTSSLSSIYFSLISFLSLLSMHVVSITVRVKDIFLRRSEKDEDGKEEIGCESLLEESLKNSQRFTALAKPNIGVGFHRLYKGFKNISQLFVYKEEMEEMEMEMEIGSPTDVKHVTHIGCDATTREDAANSFIAWETLLASSSWRQFDDQLSNPKHLPNILGHSI